MLKKSVNVRLLERRQKRNQNRPELDALLNKYDCTHNVFTMAFERAKETSPPAMFVNALGVFVYGDDTRELHTVGSTKLEYSAVPIDPDKWADLLEIAANNRAAFPKAWAEMLSTATH